MEFDYRKLANFVEFTLIFPKPKEIGRFEHLRSSKFFP
jgi:hypothetical protein